jgi:hypothetical protein
MILGEAHSLKELAEEATGNGFFRTLMFKCRSVSPALISRLD